LSSKDALLKFIPTYLLHFGYADLPLYKEFQTTEADQNLQEVCYDR